MVQSVLLVSLVLNVLLFEGVVSSSNTVHLESTTRYCNNVSFQMYQFVSDVEFFMKQDWLPSWPLA